MPKKLATGCAVAYSGEQVDGVTSTGSTPSTTEVKSVVNVAHQSDLTASPASYVIGTPTPALDASVLQQSKYGAIYESALSHKGAWLPVTFPTLDQAVLFTQTACHRRNTGRHRPFQNLEIKRRKLTVYVRVNA